MRNGSEAVRFAAIEALGRFPEAGICVRPMLAMLPSADAGFRDMLIKSIVSLSCACGLDLKTIADPDTFVPALADALISEEEEVAFAAVKGFGMMEDPRGTAAILSKVEVACGLTEASCDRLFDEAAPALMRCADEATLIAGLASEVDRVIMLAAETLGKIRAGGSVQGLAHLVVTHINREVRRTALEALGKIGDLAAVGAVLFAVSAVSDETGYVRGVAASVLGRWGERLAIEPLCKQLVVERYAEVRAAIVEALCAMADPVVCDRLIELLKHPSEEVREAAARGLGKMRAPGAFRKLQEASCDASPSVRAAVAEAVGRYAVKAAFEGLLQALRDDHEKVRLAAVMALAIRNEAAATETIRAHALTDPDVWVRYRAAEALGEKRVTAAVPDLLAIAQAAQEPDILKRMAVQALGLIGDERATDTIKALLADNDQGLAAAAEEALGRLLGGAEGDDPWK
jgi:HEAT repeat protein